MGLFSRSDPVTEVGKIVLDHAENGEVYFLTDLDSAQLLMTFPLYLDRLAYDIGGADGNALWSALYLRASEAFQVIENDPKNLDSLTYSPAISSRIVNTPAAGEFSVCEVVRLMEKRGSFLCNLETIPANAPNPEPVLAAGCEALFVYLFNTLPRDLRFFLPPVVLAQCNWYEDHGGLPSLLGLTAAPTHGFNVVREMAAGRGNFLLRPHPGVPPPVTGTS